MSAMSCGCDREAAWMCKRHLEEALNLSTVMASERAGVNYWPKPSTIDRFKQRLANENTMRDTTPAVDTPAVRMVNAAVDLLAERKRIAAVLATFYRAELSMSSVQPLLALALELNPDLVERKR